MELIQIETAYLEGQSQENIKELYIQLIENLDEDQQIDVWRQVCGFANLEMIDHLLEIGWRAAGIEDQYQNTVLHLLAQPISSNYFFISEQRIFDCTKKLLAAKVSPLRKNGAGETALLLSAKVGYYEMFQAYQEVSVKTDFTDRDGNTILHMLAQYSNEVIMNLTQAKNKLDNFENNTHLSPDSPRYQHEYEQLEWSVGINSERFKNFVTYTLIALESGFDPHQKNNVGDTSIDVAILYKSKVIGAILNGADINNKEELTTYIQAGGMNIFQACANHDLEAVHALIRLGNNPNELYDKESNKYNGMTPLAIAMQKQQFEITKVLLENGADPNMLNNKPWHPFNYLYSPESSINTDFDKFEDKTYTKILKAYINAGFDINSYLDDEENTLLTMASKYADNLRMYQEKTISTVLIEESIYADTDVNKTNREGISALMYLCLVGSERAEKNIITLLEQGASTELIDKNGKTALIYATQNSNTSTAKTYCELLAEFGDICIDAKDNTGKTALDYAAERNNEALVTWLVGKM